MTIAGKFFDLLRLLYCLSGFMMHVSNSDWTRTKNNGFMSFVPHKHKNMPQVSGKEYTNFQEHYVDMYNQLDVYKKLRRSFKITQSFVDNAPHRYLSI